MRENKCEKYADSPDCPVRHVLDRIGDKWSMLVLLVLLDQPIVRFTGIHKMIGSISQKLLAVTLKSLEADGLIKRKVYSEIPPRVEYQLTDRGKSLMPHLSGLMNWATDNMPDIKKSRSRFEKLQRKTVD